MRPLRRVWKVQIGGTAKWRSITPLSQAHSRCAQNSKTSTPHLHTATAPSDHRPGRLGLEHADLPTPKAHRSQGPKNPTTSTTASASAPPNLSLSPRLSPGAPRPPNTEIAIIGRGELWGRTCLDPHDAPSVTSSNSVYEGILCRLQVTCGVSYHSEWSLAGRTFPD